MIDKFCESDWKNASRSRDQFSEDDTIASNILKWERYQKYVPFAFAGDVFTACEIFFALCSRTSLKVNGGRINGKKFMYPKPAMKCATDRLGNGVNPVRLLLQNNN